MTQPDEPAAYAESDDAIRTIWLNKPARRNAIDDRLLDQVCQLLEDVRGDESVGVVVLRGVQGTFSSGGDRSVRHRLAAPANALRILGNQRVSTLIRQSNKPVVAAVEGWAIGAGLGLALATDIVVASESARLRPGFVQNGLSPDFATSYALVRQVGLSRAKAIVIEDRILSAAEAFDLGLFAHVWPDAEFDIELRSFVLNLVNKSAGAIALSRMVLDQASSLDLSATWALEAMSSSLLMPSPDD